MGGARQRPDPALTAGPVRRVGLLGGSFNPAHGGHRRISLAALAALRLDEVWWLVSPGNPLKPRVGMAPLPARFASARKMARLAPIRVTAIEREWRTRFTVDSLARLRRRYPRVRFIWLMGADNLAQFHLWRDWRRIARTMPIAILARPGYDARALASPAMAWLGRFRRSAASLGDRKNGTAPALVLLRFDPDPRSATVLRDRDPDWAAHIPTGGLRDGLSGLPIGPEPAPSGGEVAR